MACPTIKYGIPEDGGKEYSIDAGREIFQALPDCVKIFITNVGLERTTVKPICGTISDQTTDKAVFESFNMNWRDRVNVNWYAKENVDSSLPNGFVITRAMTCGDLNGIIYQYTDGRISASILANIDDVSTEFANSIMNKVKDKLTEISHDDQWQSLDMIINDLNTRVSPTDWQGMNVSFELFGRRIDGTDGEDKNYRINFSWKNGRGEERFGEKVYDDTPDPIYLADLVDDLMNK